MEGPRPDKFAQCELDCSVRIRKNRVRSLNNLYGSYGVQTSKIQAIKRLIFLKSTVQVRTSTDRTGCTNFFREKMHFLRAGVDKRFDAHKATHSAATENERTLFRKQQNCVDLEHGG